MVQPAVEAACGAALDCDFGQCYARRTPSADIAPADNTLPLPKGQRLLLSSGRGIQNGFTSREAVHQCRVLLPEMQTR